MEVYGMDFIKMNDKCSFPGGCTPDCAGKACGSDGCSGSCGDCSAPDTCDTSQQCNTCTPQSGNWIINCSQNCLYNSPVTITGNISMFGNGLISIYSTFTMPSKSFIYVEPPCKLYVDSTGRIGMWKEFFHEQKEKEKEKIWTRT